MSVDDQVREAAMMMPFLLIGAGKASLHHFRHAGTLLGDGEPLKVFGIPDEAVTRILREKDMRRAGSCCRSPCVILPCGDPCTFPERRWNGPARWMKPGSLF